MVRRLCVAFVLGLVITPVAATGQPPGNVPVVGILDAGGRGDADRSLWWKAFREALQELGYIEGRSIAFEGRWAEGQRDRLPTLAGELIALQVDVIVTAHTAAASAAKAATQTIPIVMATGATDPVKAGLVQSLARPGGNVTGLTSISGDLAAKRLELLKEFVPRLSGVAVILSTNSASNPGLLQDVNTTAQALGVTVHGFVWPGASQLDQALAQARRVGAGALLVTPIAEVTVERKRIADLALKHRLPTAVAGREYAEAGGLMSYAVNLRALFPRAASYVNRILKGAKPGELPVERPTKFELVINLKTAKALGLRVPPSLVQRADHLIQ